MASTILCVFKQAVLQPEGKGRPLADLIAKDMMNEVFATLRTKSGVISKQMPVAAAESDQFKEKLNRIRDEASYDA